MNSDEILGEEGDWRVIIQVLLGTHMRDYIKLQPPFTVAIVIIVVFSDSVLTFNHYPVLGGPT